MSRNVLPQPHLKPYPPTHIPRAQRAATALNPPWIPGMSLNWYLARGSMAGGTAKGMDHLLIGHPTDNDPIDVHIH